MAGPGPHPRSYLIGSWLNFSLLTLELTLGMYFLIFRKPLMSQKALIATALMLDITGSVLNTNLIYSILIKRVVFDQNVLSAAVAINSTSSMCVRGFLIFRTWSLGRNVFVTLFLTALALVHIVFAWIAAFVYTPLEVFLSVLPPKYAMVSYIAGAVNDICTTVAMLFALYRFGPRTQNLASTTSLIRHVAINVVLSGLVTTVATIITVVILFKSHDGFIVMFTCLARIYSITLLMNMLILKRRPKNTLPGSDGNSFPIVQFGRSPLVTRETVTYPDEMKDGVMASKERGRRDSMTYVESA